MAIIKKDVNFIFFILIIATVISFAGFTAYYQASFRDINEEYNTKLSELNKVTKDLLEKKAALLQTSEELNTTKQGREELGEKYNTIKDERDTLQQERDTLTENLYQAKSDLNLKTAQVTTLSGQLVDTRQDLENCNADKKYYKERYEECEDVAEDLGGSC
ncbi:hypothetical protein KY358_00665 [Candidatus Woesearchaeota archaeon]|nr:hypothetical protein [Candidatus Woesearchaeota archaeon]